MSPVSNSSNSPFNVVLIGYRGTGKTTVARLLALKLGWDWVDADVEIELRAGKSIASIFAEDGEPMFRMLESQVLADLLRRDKTVLAAGGGAVIKDGNRQALGTAGRVIWLKAAVPTILARVGADQTTVARRPNLTTAGGETEVVRMLAEREPLYRQCAHLEVDTEGKTPSVVAAEILDRLDWGPLHAEPA
jgi:shikimate kinase